MTRQGKKMNIEFDLAEDDANPYEEACKEWLKGCSNTEDDTPYKCNMCTKAFYKELKRLQIEEDFRSKWEGK